MKLDRVVYKVMGGRLSHWRALMSATMLGGTSWRFQNPLSTTMPSLCHKIYWPNCMVTQASTSRAHTVQAIATLRCILEKSMDHMPHRSCILSSSEKVVKKGSSCYVEVEGHHSRTQRSEYFFWTERGIRVQRQQDKEVEL